MKPHSFQYHAPETLAEVVALLAEHDGDARVLAGGQSLVPLMNLRMAQPEVLIDLNRCAELTGIAQVDGALCLGAMVRQIDAERSPLVAELCPLICRALALAGPRAVRNRATVGGPLAHADRSAELPGVAVALDAVFEIASAEGIRDVPAAEFFMGDMMTAVEGHEMLAAVRFPVAPPTAFGVFHETGLRREGVALVGLAAQVDLQGDGTVASAAMAVIGVEPAPARLRAAEAALTGQRLTPELIETAARLASEGLDAADDAVASARYRTFVAGSLVRKALGEAVAATHSRPKEHA